MIEHLFLLSSIILLIILVFFLFFTTRRYRRILKNYSSSFELISEGVLLLSSSLKVLWLNKMSCQYLGLPKNRLLNKFIDDEALMLEQNILQKCRDLSLLALRNKQVVSEVLTLIKGENRQVEIIIFPTYTADLIVILKSNGMDKKIGDLSRDFVSNASHELRTPITIIKGFAETLDEVKDLSPEMVREIVGKILRNCERMESLVKNLLLLSDLDNLAECKLHPSNLEDIIDFCMTQVKEVYPETSITFAQEGKEYKVTVDKDLIEIAVMNLLKNAVKYSPSPAHIEITVHFFEDEVKIAIQDHGIGIKKEDLIHIFERFYRVDKARSRKLGGAGLGLSIVKNIIIKHGGTITVNSEEGVGTVFEISLPREVNSSLF